MKYKYLFFKFTLFLLLGALSLPAIAQTIKGKVTDAETKEPMVGTTVSLKETGRSQYVKLDGYFTFKNLKPGDYTLEFRFVSYKTRLVKVNVTNLKTTTLNVVMEPTTNELNSVSIVDNESATDRRSRTIEKNSNQLVNVVSARSIELSPDITVANVMQRVSGVTIERSNSGEGRYPIIRGMDKRYINTLVNGIKIPSPDNKNRFIPLDLFPAELLERLEVSKTLTPSMEGDAIGGTINLVMKDAPSATLLQASFSAGYNSVFAGRYFEQFDRSTISKLAPTEIKGNSYAATAADFPVNNLHFSNKANPININFGVTFGDRLFKDKKLGFIVSTSYQDNFTGNNSTFFLPNASPGVNNVPTFSDLEARTYSQESRRIGVNNKFDYKFNNRNKISLVNVFVRLDDYQTRRISDTISTNALVDAFSRSRWQYQSIYNSTLQGIHQLDDALKFDWSVAYSQANNHIPDQAEFDHEYPITQTTVSSDNLQGMSRIWTHNSDQDYSVYLNLTDNFKLLNRKFELKLGGLERNKSRDSYYNSYSLSPYLGTSNNQVYTTIDAANFTFKTTDKSLFVPDGNDYTFKENIAAAYIQGKWQLTDKLEALGGVRVEYTKQNYATQLPASVDAATGIINYTDFLPTALLKYALKDNESIRLSYNRALARPAFSDMIPGGQMGEVYQEQGNPLLNHTTADNLDLRYDLFPKNADEILLGAFYKKIYNPIEYEVSPKGTTAILMPKNDETDATNYGFEAVFTKYFGPMGVVANYTYTKSKITTAKVFTYRNDAGIISSRVQDETHPLQGQSDHIANMSLIYRNAKLGLNLQGAFVYTGTRVAFVNPAYGLDYYQAPTEQLDFSAEKTLCKKFTFFAKANNLTNTPYVLELHQSYNAYLANGQRPLALQTDVNKVITVQKDSFKANYLFGIRYKL
ncbi:TonB-dependent receptor [Mucilaginibacter paludis]|uniref:TonB-dependent receptor n=1 Tax=Mucilaginibacter paludis DSM 18603 TaxID=714943 RepID=H1YEV3_9SPHI|nr:TonB-dependent receptor [Mucilaginibacter paludis]EHQ24370.1 TonB-dependent receptor [Mucilaginibacter paludis DSM 18603]